jgi:hypothetical protein
VGKIATHDSAHHLLEQKAFAGPLPTDDYRTHTRFAPGLLNDVCQPGDEPIAIPFIREEVSNVLNSECV